MEVSQVEQNVSHSEAVPAETPRLTVFGWLLFFIGIAAMIGSLLMPTSISSDASDRLNAAIAGISISSAPIVNLGLLQQQMLMFQAGCTAMIAGAVLATGGLIARGLAPRDVPPLPVR